MDNYFNLKELVLYARKNYSERDAFYIRNKVSYDTITFDTFTTQILKLAASLLDRGYSNGKHIALVGENSYNWVVSYLAAVSTGCVIVPIDKELPSDEIVAVYKKSDALMLMYSASYAEPAKEIMESLGGELIIIDKPKSKLTEISTSALIEGYTKNDFQERIEAIEIDRYKIAAIVFTSGTTGVSKGVMLSHNNQITNIKACFDMVKFQGNRFSLLPLHHTYELTLGLLYPIALGCATSFNNSIKYISQNIQIFKPTDLILVPLIAEALHNSIWDKIRSGGKENLVRNMIKFSNLLLKVGIDIRRVLFKQVHAGLGGRVVNIFCGGAKVEETIARSFVDFGFKFRIGYGITECSPLISGNIACVSSDMAHCGYSASCCELDIFEPNSEGEGEVIVKGENVMLGYYNNPEATAAVIKDGWYHTGDIGKLGKKGELYITGRIKNIIVLKNGKNIYPEELEGYIYTIPYVKEVVVYALGSSLGQESALAAEVFINEDRAAADNIEDVKAVVKAEIDKINQDIAYYKRISKVHFRDSEFIKTTTKKIKRDKIDGKQ
ncbi:MAG: AMP-binding protein [Rikenellaceae bacterium]